MMMNSSFPQRLAVTGFAGLLMLLAGTGSLLNATPGPPQEQDDNTARVKQLQRELEDLKRSYEQLQTRTRPPVSPAAPSTPEGAVVGGYHEAPTYGLRSSGSPEWRLAPTATTVVRGNPGNSAFSVSRLPALAVYGFNGEAQRRISELVRGIRETEDGQAQQALKVELQTELEKQYDAYLESLEQPLTEMENRLDKLREQYESRKSARDEMVKLKLNTLWNEANGMGWPGETRGGGMRFAPSVAVRREGLFPNRLDNLTEPARPSEKTEATDESDATSTDDGR